MSTCVQNVTKYWVSSVTQLWHFCSILIFTERQGGDSEDKVMTSLMDPELPIARSIPNSRHEQRSASCSCPSRESCSNGALFSFSAAAGKLFLHRTEPCWNGDQLKSCWAKKKLTGFVPQQKWPDALYSPVNFSGEKENPEIIENIMNEKEGLCTSSPHIILKRLEKQRCNSRNVIVCFSRAKNNNNKI